MNKRMIEIIEYFKEKNGIIDIKELALHFKINERTLRYDIQKINTLLEEKNYPQIYKSSKGKLKGNIPPLGLLINKNDSKTLMRDYKETLMLIIVAFEEGININSVCKLFDLGRTTVKNTLKNIKKILDLYNLNLISKGQRGLILQGNEEDIRRLQLKIINHYTNFNEENIENNFIKDHLEIYLNGYHSFLFQEFIEQVSTSLNRIISDEAYKTISNYILIMFLRITNGKTLTSISNKNFFYETKEYKVIKDYVQLLEDEYQLKINNYEILKLTDYFLGSHIYNKGESSFNNWVEIELIIKKFINSFSNTIGINLNKDKSLLDSLNNHIKPVLYRIKNNIEIENSIEEEFKKNYPQLFEDAKKSINILEEFIGHSINDNEIAFIALHLKASLEVNKSVLYKNTDILIVCGMGYGTSKLIAQQIREIYQVNILDTIPQNQLVNYIKSSRPHLIITTTKLDVNTKNIPIIKINAILTKVDFENLDSHQLPKYTSRVPMSLVINTIQNSCDIKNLDLLKKELTSVFNETLIQDVIPPKAPLTSFLSTFKINIIDSSASWEEAILLANKPLFSNGSVSDSYGLAMVDSIKKNGPYMVTDDKLALPHSKNENNIFKTDMSILILKEPILFPEGLEVEVILAFASKDDFEHLDALSEFVDLVKDYNFIEFLKKENSPKKIMDKIKKYEFLTKLGRHK